MKNLGIKKFADLTNFLPVCLFEFSLLTYMEQDSIYIELLNTHNLSEFVFQYNAEHTSFVYLMTNVRDFTMKRSFFTKYILFCSIFFALSFFLSSKAHSRSPDENPITKDLEVTLTTHAERFSDLEYWQYNPKGEEIDYRLLQSESDMLTDQLFELGTKADEREGCIETIDTRRTGTCEDGIYQFKMRSTDAAGNQSEWGSYQIARDTVRPGKPEFEC